MFSRRVSKALFVILTLCVPALRAVAQEKPASPATQPAASSDPQEPLRVLVEEVRIPVVAYDESGRFDPTLEAADLLIREDGVAQQIKGVYRVPAYVLLLVDTGGELNPSKNVRLTREVAISLISGLRQNDWSAVLQVNNRVELVQSWTTDQAEVLKALRSKLLPGKRSVLAAGIVAAVDHLQKTPLGNRHLVLISDGLDSTGGRVELEEAVKSLTAANVTVHVISYTALGRKARRPEVTRPREKSSLPHEAVIAIPHTRRPRDPRPDLRDINEAKGGGVVDLDRLLRRGKNIKVELEQRERQFGELTEETGGGLWLPSTAEEMIRQAEGVAREVDSQYVVTYRPQRPLGHAVGGEYRKIDVIPRKVGLRVRSRRGYVARAAEGSSGL